MDSNIVYFEQPLNEHTRVCLRLEAALNGIDYFLNDHTSASCFVVLSNLANILNITDRADLRAKLGKELGRYHQNLLKISKSPQVDTERITVLIAHVERVYTMLHENTGPFAHILRENEFLSHVRQHMNTPGGLCLFDTPAVTLWLELPAKQRDRLLDEWLDALTEIRTATNTFLSLTRDSASPVKKIAMNGIFQASLDPQLPSQLVRVALPIDSGFIPRISVGRYGINIRFQEANYESVMQTTTRQVEFELTCCIF